MPEEVQSDNTLFKPLCVLLLSYLNLWHSSSSILHSFFLLLLSFSRFSVSLMPISLLVSTLAPSHSRRHLPSLAPVLSSSIAVSSPHCLLNWCLPCLPLPCLSLSAATLSTRSSTSTWTESDVNSFMTISSTDCTSNLNSLAFVLIRMFVAVHAFLSLSYAVLVLFILLLVSCGPLPDIVTIAPTCR